MNLCTMFSGHGGGWGYSGHSIEAVRFMPDTDILLGGFGLFGGRGEYFGKIKVSNCNIVHIIILNIDMHNSVAIPIIFLKPRWPFKDIFK